MYKKQLNGGSVHSKVSHLVDFYYKSNSNFIPLDSYLVYFTLLISNNFLDTFTASVSLYLSLKYITSFIPDWIIAFAHSLHGNNATYILLPRRDAPV